MVPGLSPSSCFESAAVTRPRATDWIVMAALVICWGSTFAALKIAVAHIHPLWNTVFRIWIGVATLLVVIALQRQALPPLRDPAWRQRWR